MGIFRIGPLLQQDVNIVYFFAFLLGLCVLVVAERGASSAQVLAASLPQPTLRKQPDSADVIPSAPSHHPLCPDGWVRGYTGSQSFKDKLAGLCMYLSPQSVTWTEARDACHDRDSVLLSLDSVLSVEDKLFQQYLKDKGVNDVWTGLHKEGGHQIWDERGKGMVAPFMGSQHMVGLSKRGWRWDLSSFSDATLTCGVYGYTAEQSLTARRSRRDTDTPSSTVIVKAANTEDSPPPDSNGPTEKNLESFKSFLSDQGLKHFADNINDSPNDKTMDISSSKTNTTTSDKHSDPHTSKTNQSPARQTDNKQSDRLGHISSQIAKPANMTTEKMSSDEEDSNHEISKRSTPSMTVMVTTENPAEGKNVTAPSNTTKAPLMSTPATLDLPKSKVNRTSSRLFHHGSGFNPTLMGFFNMDSGRRKNQHTSGSNSGSDSDAKKDTQVPTSVQEFVQRFQTDRSKSSGQLPSNSTSDEQHVTSTTVTPQSVLQNVENEATKTQSSRKESMPVQTEAPVTEASPNKMQPPAARDVVMNFRTDAENTTSIPLELSKDTVTDAQIPASSINNTQQYVALPEASEGRQQQVVSTVSPLYSSTTSSSSEEDTTDSSSKEHTNTTSRKKLMDSLDFFPDTKTTRAPSFQQHFGTSPRSTTLPTTTTPQDSTTESASSSSGEMTLEYSSVEATTTVSLSTDSARTAPPSDPCTTKADTTAAFDTNSSELSKSSANSEETETTTANTRSSRASSGESTPPPQTESTSTEGKTQWAERGDVSVQSDSSNTATKLKDALGYITPSPDALAPPAGHSWMALQPCNRKHQFVCTAKPVHDFQPVRKCDGGWLGHSLVSRCYLVVNQPTSQAEAASQCRARGSMLAMADTAFFTNVTAMLHDRLVAKHAFDNRIWISMPGAGPTGQCSMMEAHGKGMRHVPCDTRLPYFCQKNVSQPDASSRYLASKDMLDEIPLVVNMTSWALHSLQCPLDNLTHIRSDDVVTWYKDGQLIPSSYVRSGSPNRLSLSIHLLRLLGMPPGRQLKPALLQGLYWCKIWRQHPMHTITSRRIFVRFQDVVTLQGFIKTSEVTLVEAVLFNEMDDHSGMAGAMERDLQVMSDSTLHNLQVSQPFLSDIAVITHRLHWETDEAEFRTYLCLTVDNMEPQDKGAVVDDFLTGLHTELVAAEDTVRRKWNLSLPFEQAFRLLMTEMCPESRLMDKTTGQAATFPSTPANGHTLSVDTCNGEYVGYAKCSGDLLSGAQWSYWQVDTPCQNSEVTESQDNSSPTKLDPSLVVKTDTGFVLPAKPKLGLQVIDEVHIEPENVADVTDRLADILNTSVDLTDVDVEIVADIIDRVALVPSLPQDVGFTLMKTVNRVLDSPLQTLQLAQRRTQASTRILKDLDKFSEKLDFGPSGSGHVRYVMPNIAMEVWNLRSALEPVIGLAATVAGDKGDPLSVSRIVTLSNRTWADLHLSSFDVAIELPEHLVSGDGAGNGRLSMAIYRKAGLFLSSLHSHGGSPSGDNALEPELNSAIISATLASQSVRNLTDKVKLIFKPVKTAADMKTECVYWDFSLPHGGGWSTQGCVFNGTVQGRDICLCDHLTNFAVLLDFYGDDNPIDKDHVTALSVITIIGLSLSILGLALTVITFIFFKKLRKGRAQQTLFNMSVALLCSEVVLLMGLKQTHNYSVCLVVAVLLHYFILVSFLWMLIEAVLQYLTFVKVLGTYISKYTVKTVLPAWGIPLIPVICVLSMDYTQYHGRTNYCWMKVDTFYYAFALPVGIIILFNIVTFVVIMFSLLRRPEGLRSTKSKGQTAETNVKAAFTIFVLLGLTWVFGYLAIEDARLPFQYLFTAFSSLQGFFIFVLLVARRRQFREQWQALCCRRGIQARGQRVTPTLSNSTSSHTSGSSFTSSSRSRSSSGGSCKTLHSLIKRADSNASRTGSKVSQTESNVPRSKVQPQLSSKESATKPR